MNLAVEYDVVVPTTGRPALGLLLGDLARADGPRPGRVVVVDDRPAGSVGADPAVVADTVLPASAGIPVVVVRSGGRGPAAARNAGWRSTTAPWVAFLDDDVRLTAEWPDVLVRDLAAAAPDVGAVQGRVIVPLPPHRPPTDWERNVAGLSNARWITADMALRRSALAAVGGFDERFPRAYREDADLAARVRAAGYRLAVGDRTVRHPVGPAGRWASVRRQAGNADDALLRARYGRRWRAVVDAGPGRIGRHTATTAALVVGGASLLAGRRGAAVAAAATWGALTGAFFAARVRPGPRDAGELLTLAVTSAVIPPVAVAWRVRGALATWRAARRGLAPDAVTTTAGNAVDAVLFDRDGTLIEDVPYNGDPRLVRLMPTAGDAVARARAAGVRVGIITNQSGVARGLLTRTAVDDVNRRVEELLGPFDVVVVCPHGEGDGCGCRKPASGMVRRAAEVLQVPAAACAVVGDTGADVDAALGVGAPGVLVPNARTRDEEIARALLVARDVLHATEIVLAR